MSFREKLFSRCRASRSRVILALDVTGQIEKRAERALTLLHKLESSLAAVKINLQLLLPFGLDGLVEITSRCSRAGLPVIADLKLNDIEATNLDVIELLFHSGFDAVTANPIVGIRQGLGEVIRRSHSLRKGVILLVYMSHTGAREGYSLRIASSQPLYRVFARRVKRWNADGAVVSARSFRKIKEVRRLIGPRRLILSPGVGAQGGDPIRAISAGSDFIIVGRTVIESDDPRAALDSIRLSLPPP